MKTRVMKRSRGHGVYFPHSILMRGPKMAQSYLKNESAQISRAIQKRVEPASASAAMLLYWAAEMVGENADGLAILKAYAARGVPLPIEVPSALTSISEAKRSCRRGSPASDGCVVPSSSHSRTGPTFWNTAVPSEAHSRGSRTTGRGLHSRG